MMYNNSVQKHREHFFFLIVGGGAFPAHARAHSLK